MKIINEDLIYKEISKDFTIKLDNNKKIIVNKWMKGDYFNSNYETDYKIIDGKDIYDKLSEEKKEEFDDFVNEIKL